MRKIIAFTALLGFLGASAQEADTKYSNDGVHKGLDYSVTTGYMLGVGDAKGAGAIPVEFGLGKQFHPNLYVGLRTGAWIGTSSGARPQVPVLADVKLMFPGSGSSNTKIKPIINARLGYVVMTRRTSGGGTVEVPDPYGGTKTEDVPETKIPDLIAMELSPGLQIPVSSTADFLISAGYAHSFPTKGGGGSGYFVLKAGMNFHQDPLRGPKPKKLPREKVDTRRRGLQYTLEASGNMLEEFGGGANFVLTYKLNPHFSVGLGGGCHVVSPFVADDGEDNVQLVRIDRDGETHEYMHGYSENMLMGIVFLRGNYRMTARRLSPIVSVDAGMRISMRTYGEICDNISYYEADMLAGTLDKKVGNGLFVSPAIGASLRTTKNSYLELKVGYFITQNLDGTKGSSDDRRIYISTGDKKISCPHVSLGFTHTMGRRGKRPAL